MANLRLALRMLFRTPRSPRSPSSRWRSASAPTPRSSRSTTRCCCGRCRWRIPTRWSTWARPGPRPGRSRRTTPAREDPPSATRCSATSRRRRPAFSGIAAHRLLEVNLAFQGQTTAGQGMLVSGSYFGVLGLTPAAGRLIGPDDDRTPGAHDVVVLSHAYWRTAVRDEPGGHRQHASSSTGCR